MSKPRLLDLDDPRTAYAHYVAYSTLHRYETEISPLNARERDSLFYEYYDRALAEITRKTNPAAS